MYLDLGFFDELRSRFGAPGEFAEAYVIAHEFGHHVQTLLGIEAKVHRAMEDRLEPEEPALGETGATGRRGRGLEAPSAVGDDRLQKAATGRVSPESWTHGSSKARTEWFTLGFQTGQVGACDTFARAAR